jgi:hypothetical protein
MRNRRNSLLPLAMDRNAIQDADRRLFTWSFDVAVAAKAVVAARRLDPSFRGVSEGAPQTELAPSEPLEGQCKDLAVKGKLLVPWAAVRARAWIRARRSVGDPLQPPAQCLDKHQAQMNRRTASMCRKCSQAADSVSHLEAFIPRSTGKSSRNSSNSSFISLRLFRSAIL